MSEATHGVGRSLDINNNNTVTFQKANPNPASTEQHTTQEFNIKNLVHPTRPSSLNESWGMMQQKELEIFMSIPFLQTHPIKFRELDKYVKKNVNKMVDRNIKEILSCITDTQNKVHRNNIEILFAAIKLFDPKEVPEMQIETEYMDPAHMPHLSYKSVGSLERF